MKTKDFKSKVTGVEDKGIVEIQVSAFGNIDSYGDVMTEKAFNKTIKDGFKRVKHLKDHSWNLLLGLPLEMEATKDGLRVVSKMNLEKELARETFSDYKFFAEEGRTLEHSIGYKEIKTEKGEQSGEEVLFLKEVQLFEYSTLNFMGANEKTPLLGIKSELETIELMIQKGNFSDEKCKLLLEKYNELKTLLTDPQPQSVEDKPKPNFIFNLIS
jgi:HK97 family phage prohead protease